MGREITYETSNDVLPRDYLGHAPRSHYTQRNKRQQDLNKGLGRLSASLVLRIVNLLSAHCHPSRSIMWSASRVGVGFNRIRSRRAS